MKLFKLSIVALAVAGLTACSLEGDDGNDGAAGVDGSNGLNSLTVQTALAVGDTNCPNSGVQFDSGRTCKIISTWFTHTSAVKSAKRSVFHCKWHLK